MTQYATIKGLVTYTPGDGLPIPIPEGRIEVIEAPDSMTLGWEEEEGVVGSTAMPRTQFEEYVEAGKITMES
ncbi:hypothetical protein NF681_09940 [Comamonadaceae bacterium OTU4NAUVB1]|jgi:hypothetical protein|nr:hypothetical protein NF681_09940 [Comamonadaceae bacterium OTU4NAUVB1]HSU20741.1 hypothetical protein [Variovorax sp.]